MCITHDRECVRTLNSNFIATNNFICLGLLQVKVVQHAEEGCFPGLYCSNLIANPWLPDNSTLLLSSAWRSQQVILGVNVERLDDFGGWIVP